MITEIIQVIIVIIMIIIIVVIIILIYPNMSKFEDGRKFNSE